MRDMPGIAKREDADLLYAFVAGDAAAMEELVARHRCKLFGWLAGMVRDRATAEDLYQDIWLKIIRSAGSFRDVSFSAWMWRIARNRLSDYYRRQKRAPKLTLDAPVGDDPDAPSQVDLVAAAPVDLDGAGEEAARLRLLREAVGELPAVQREVVLMRVQAGLSFKEIAERTGISINTALARMSYARERLRKIIATRRQ